jgi:hypothetical protein
LAKFSGYNTKSVVEYGIVDLIGSDINQPSELACGPRLHIFSVPDGCSLIKRLLFLRPSK